MFNSFLDTKDLPYPNPDLIIRTGKEKRLSGFLLWQSQYSELYFSNKYFPDFNEKELLKALKEYSKRQRRFGG
ncbi:MAG: undecaprenyl diphosphate synthase family protein [Patescibacteria group bacterium]|nr:undecaprenyl diphosphate synthase family protein [Patescibacteria group bacterium]